MQKRELGRSGLEVSALGLGCMGMSEFYGPADDDASIQVLHHALDLGIDFFDTADVYGPLKNERLLGRALAHRRDDVVIATKFGIVRDEQGGWHGISGKPDYVRACCEGSLERLGVDTIDLYYQHRVDPDTPIEDTVGAMKELVDEGKVKHIGLSEAAPETIRRAHDVHPITALQTEYSLWSREPEQELFDTCRELGIGFVAYSPLGRGFLAGQIKNTEELSADDYRRRAPRFSGENFDANMQIVLRIQELAAARGCSAAQFALAWVLARSENIVAIPGTTKIHRLDENAAAMDIELSPEDLAEIDALFPPTIVQGGRYDDGGMRTVNR